jgi:DNA-binding winged helix-turn-helix (wHTH) protein/tetratricopeptide (TPR) repeat protein
MIVHFGEFEADSAQYRLRRAGVPVEIEPQAFEVLCYLIVQRERVVSKEELVERVWSGRFVTDAAVARAVQKARRALDDDGRTPRWIENVHGRGYRFVGDARSESPPVEDAASPDVLPSPPPLTEGAPATATSRPGAKWTRAAALALVATALALFGWVARDGDPAPLPPAPIAEAPRPAVAVLPFADGGDDVGDDRIGEAMAEMLASEVAAGDAVRAVAPTLVARTVRELGLEPGAAPAAGTRAAVRSLLAADYLATGSFLRTSGEPAVLRVDVRLEDAVRGVLVAAFSETGEVAQLPELAVRVGERLRLQLGAEPLDRHTARRARAALPADGALAALYSAGLAHLRQGDPAAAVPLLERAIAAETTYAPARAALAAALRDLGYERRAHEEAVRAQTLAAALPRALRLAIEAQVHETKPDWRRAAESWGALWRFYPDDLEAGLRLASAQSAAGLGDDAGATVDALRELPFPARADPRIDLADSVAARARNDARRQQEAAAAAARTAETLGARRLLAEAWLEEGYGWLRLGEPARARELLRRAEEASERLGDRQGRALALHRLAAAYHHEGDYDQVRSHAERARDLYRDLGQRSSEAACLITLGNLRVARSDPDGARRTFEEARRILLAIGNLDGLSRTLRNLAGLAYAQGDAKEAQRYAEEGLARHRELGSRQGQAYFLLHLGDSFVLQNRLDEAAERAQEAALLLREAGDRQGEASALNSVGSIRSRQGRLEEAATMLAQALQIFRDIGYGYGVADGLNRSANNEYQRGRVAEALRLHRESLAAYEAIPQRFGIGIVSYGLGLDLLALGDPAAAAPRFRLAIDVFRELDNTGFRAESERGLAEALLLQGDLAASRAAIARALDLLGRKPQPEVARNVRMTAARLAIEDGRFDEAAASARQTLPEFAAASDDEAAWREVLGLALLGRSEIEPARAAIARALALTERSERQLLRLGIEISAARLTEASGDLAAAETALVGVATRADELGLLTRRLEASLALAELRLRGGGPAAQTQLASLADEARGMGLGLLARRAARARL